MRRHTSQFANESKKSMSESDSDHMSFLSSRLDDEKLQDVKFEQISDIHIVDISGKSKDESNERGINIQEEEQSEYGLNHPIRTETRCRTAIDTSTLLDIEQAYMGVPKKSPANKNAVMASYSSKRPTFDYESRLINHKNVEQMTLN